MYLSRLQLNSYSRQMWRTVIDRPYKLHQLVMSGFPDGITREDAHVLHRLEIESDTAILLVQSDIKPQWDKVHPDLLLPASPFDPVPNPAVREMNGVQLDNGRILQFRLTANPTLKKKRDGKKHSNRVPLVHEDQQLAWLNNKAGQHGFRLLHVTITQSQKQVAWKAKQKQSEDEKQPPITLYTVQFNGRLQITNTEQFQTAVRTGIGPAKAFGCGLLSLARG